MSSLIQFTPHLITGVAIFSAIFLHWYWPQRFWLPSILTAVLTSITSFTLFKFVPRTISDEEISQTTLALGSMGFALASSFVLALLVGYLMKFAPSLFK